MHLHTPELCSACFLGLLYRSSRGDEWHLGPPSLSWSGHSVGWTPYHRWGCHGWWEDHRNVSSCGKPRKAKIHTSIKTVHNKDNGEFWVQTKLLVKCNCMMWTFENIWQQFLITLSVKPVSENKCCTKSIYNIRMMEKIDNCKICEKFHKKGTVNCEQEREQVIRKSMSASRVPNIFLKSHAKMVFTFCTLCPESCS